MNWQKIKGQHCFVEVGLKIKSKKGPHCLQLFFHQRCRREYTLLFRAGTVLLFVMYSWRWDIHHSCCVGQTWLSNSSRVKSSWSTIPFFPPYTCFHPEARKPKTSAHLVPWGNIGIFNNMLWKKPSSIHPLAELQPYPKSCTAPPTPTILCIQKPTQMPGCHIHTLRHVCTQTCTFTHTHTVQYAHAHTA